MLGSFGQFFFEALLLQRQITKEPILKETGVAARSVNKNLQLSFPPIE